MFGPTFEKSITRPAPLIELAPELVGEICKRLFLQGSLLFGCLLALVPFQASPRLGPNFARAHNLQSGAPANQDEGVYYPEGRRGGLHDFASERRSKPPRGYCTQISRVIDSSSRCYEHLVQHQRALIPSSANLDSAPSAKKRNKGSQGDGSSERRDEEELVYVRLETLGSDIRDLNTRVVNERLFVGVFNQLLGSSSLSSAPDSNGNRGGTSGEPNIRAQILEPTIEGGDYSTGSRCRLAIERFLCRFAYPTCHYKRSDISALVRPPCREDCLILKEVYCSNLNWFKFTSILQQAINETLASIINVLDLETEGNADDLNDDGSSLGGNHYYGSDSSGNNNDYVGGLNKSMNPRRVLEKYIDLNASTHLYWPHERSLARCELLPPTIGAGGSARQGKLLKLFRQRRNSSTGISHKQRRFGNEKARHLKGGKLDNNRWPICSNAHLTDALVVGPDSAIGLAHLNDANLNGAPEECLNSANGFEYRGSRNFTLSGRVCQAWRSQWPHRHSSSELLLTNLCNAENFCRNVGGIERKPWCYTKDQNVRWEYCDIELCRT